MSSDPRIDPGVYDPRLSKWDGMIEATLMSPGRRVVTGCDKNATIFVLQSLAPLDTVPGGFCPSACVRRVVRGFEGQAIPSQRAEVSPRT